MSRETIRTIKCDSCGWEMRSDNVDTNGMNFIPYASEAGWATRGRNEFGLDFCPDCWEKLRDNAPIIGDKIYGQNMTVTVDESHKVFIDAIRKSGDVKFDRGLYDRHTDYAVWRIVVKGEMVE